MPAHQPDVGRVLAQLVGRGLGTLGDEFGHAESGLREVVGARTFDDILGELGGRQVLVNETQQQIQALLDRYGAGLQVTKVSLQSAQPPEEAGPKAGLFIQLTRPQGATLSEILVCLRAVLEGLPRREAPARAGSRPPSGSHDRRSGQWRTATCPADCLVRLR